MQVVVVGAGISGLTAATSLVRAGHTVVVLEGADRPGGKIVRGSVGGVVVDLGAEAMVNRRPEGVALAASVGLDVVHPTTASSRVWTRGALRPLPRTLMGWPLDLDQLEASGILSSEGMVRARHQYVGGFDGDVSVGEVVGQVFGDEVVDRLVEPLLGGVYAGHARAISARAAMPQLLSLAAGRPLPVVPAATAASPVFAGVEGGMGVLVDRLVAGLDVRLSTTVREVRRTAEGFEVATGPVPSPSVLAADAVVLATPAAPTARLLADLAPVAAAELAAIDCASMAVVSLAFRTADLPVGLGEASGFLVPPVDGRRVKASTFSFAKWDWVRRAGAAEGLSVLRTSLGRLGDEATLQRSDEELVADSLADLRDAVGLTAIPVDAVVQRWGGGLPQYAVGHLDRVARVRAAVEQVPGLAVCGAAYDGVGIAGCIASGHAAASRLQ